ncbi:hypothetical protein [Sorangium sp. So ce363]|uniref:hypothetical protein n=1 Tax=Sorangium sp. So ce363 TaxID=3133304 RepID=UPI003F5D6953
MDTSTINSTHNLVELAFLTRWKATDFSTWNEQTIREEFIIRLLHLLGYRKGTTHDLEMEKELRLAEPYHRIGRKKVAIDYAPSLRLRYFWIVEAKPGRPREMQFGDVLQAHLYAIHPEVQARFIVLCNGWEVRVYDALTLRTFDDALHVCRREDCTETFGDLKGILGSEHMLSFQRKRLVSLARDTLDVEVDIERFRQFKDEMSALLRSGEARVRENERQLQSKHFKDWINTEQSELRAASLSSLFISMDLPEDGRRPPAEEFIRRVLAGTPAERQELMNKLAMQYRARPHNIFRGIAVYILVRLLEEGVTVEKSAYVHSIKNCIEELAGANINYWSSHSLSNALCHLDNAAMRTAYKFCTRLGMQFHAALNEDAKKAMTAEERVGMQPSVARLMVSSVGHAQEVLWRKYCSARTPQEIWDGVWTLQAAEAELDKLPATQYPDDDSDILFFEHQGFSIDQLRAATWNALNNKVELLRHAGVTENIITFAMLTWEELPAGIPPEPRAPEGFAPSWQLKDLAQELLPKVLALRAAAMIAQVEGDYTGF